MQDRWYLLSLEEDYNPGEAYEKLDRERLKKLEHIKNGRKQLESLGAGLLLQLAVQEAVSEQEALSVPQTVEIGDTLTQPEAEKEEKAKMVHLTFPQLLSKLHVPLPLEYTYGQQGKPYLKNYPYYYSLSHSGDYVLCVLSEQEVGADIQKMTDTVNESLLQRFFSADEKALWQQCDTEEARRDFFYRLWCRKEAYGKLTGEGIVRVVGVNMCIADNADSTPVNSDCDNEDTVVQVKRQTEKEMTYVHDFMIEDYEGIENYKIAVCKWKSR